VGKIRRWDATSMGLLCVESVRAIHQPPARFRVSPSSYPAGTSFSGVAWARCKYVVAGACCVSVGLSVWELQAGDIADIPAGRYEFRVSGAGPLETVSVWELPPES